MTRALLSLLLMVLAGSAVANTLSEAGFRQLERAQALLSAGDAKGAVDVLDTRFPRAEHDGERALIRQVQGFALAAIPRNRAAIERLQQALVYEQLPEPAALQSRLALGQLLYVEGDLPGAIRVLERYLAEAGDQSAVEAQVMLASAHVSAGEPQKAKAPLAAAMVRRNPPPLAWLELQLAIDYGLKAWASAADTLLTLVARAPDSPQYWQQLSGVYYELGRQPQTLAALALAHRNGVLDEPRSLQNLALLYQSLGSPYKAAELLSSAMGAGTLPGDAEMLDRLSDAWIAAREYDRSVSVLERRLAMQASAAARLRLAQVHVQRHDWSAVIQLFGRDVATLEGGAALLLGMAAFEQDDLPLAQRAFSRAQAAPEQRRAADQWLRYLGEMAAR